MWIDGHLTMDMSDVFTRVDADGVRHVRHNPALTAWPFLLVSQQMVREQTIELEFLDPVTIFEFSFGPE
jgi:hypothetical protein